MKEGKHVDVLPFLAVRDPISIWTHLLFDCTFLRRKLYGSQCRVMKPYALTFLKKSAFI